MSALGLQRTLAPVAVVVLVVSGCGGSHHTGASGILSVDASGRIGPLRVDVSDRRAVVTFVGKPDAERRGTSLGTTGERSARYDALGYGCARQRPGPNTDVLPLVRGGPWCRTVYFIRGERLGLFYTTQARYVDSHGVHVGMATATAERLLRKRIIVGCIAALELTSPGVTPVLRFAFGGGKITHTQLPHLRGGRVASLILHSAKHDPGVFECE